MIRLVPIPAECNVIHETDCFAFYDTRNKEFLKVGDSSAFESIKDLREAWTCSCETPSLLRRLEGLAGCWDGHNPLSTPRG
jgi:hypothetical protein